MECHVCRSQGTVVTDECIVVTCPQCDGKDQKRLRLIRTLRDEVEKFIRARSVRRPSNVIPFPVDRVRPREKTNAQS